MQCVEKYGMSKGAVGRVKKNMLSLLAIDPGNLSDNVSHHKVHPVSFQEYSTRSHIVPP